MLDEPEIVTTDARPIALVRVTVPRERIREVMGPGLEELRAEVAAQGVTIVGSWFTHHFRMDPQVFDFAIGVPVASPVVVAGRIEPSETPVQRAARTVYHGGYEGLAAAWAEFIAWIDAAGHTKAADLWETYLAGPESSPDPTQWRTELIRPLTR